MIITSRRNWIVQHVRAVAKGARAAPPGLCFIEGVHLVEEWLKSGLAADAMLVSDRFGSSPRGAELLARLEADGCGYSVVTDGVLDSVSNVRQHQGIAAAIGRPACTLADVLCSPEPLIVVAAGLQDPGNLGTILRTAHAAGADGAAVTAGSVSPFNAKCIRASAGSALRLPVADGVAFDDLAALARSKSVKLIACSSSAPMSYLEADLTGGAALLFGQEGSGLPPEVERGCDMTVSIPTAPGVDSLNVAASAAVILYEAARQRSTF